MSEDEAKGKWCPFVRLITGKATASGAEVQGLGPSAFNHITAGDVISTPHAAKCIGSDCMAWRWAKVPTVERGTPYIQAIKAWREKHAGSLLDAKNAVDATWISPSSTDGFCGLAGVPQ